jgi:ADP-ribosylglycohydrolase
MRKALKGHKQLQTSVFLAKNGRKKQEIKEFIEVKFGYDLNRTIDEIRPIYEFDVSCQGSVPESIIAFLESESFEDSIRTAISIGGDSDTIASMTGAISEAYYKSIPQEFIVKMNEYLPKEFRKIIEEFKNKYSA